MSKLPDGWCLVEIGQITTDANQTIPEPGEHFRYIDIGSVNRVKKCIETPEILTGENAPSRARKRLRANDVLVSMTRPNLNAVAMVNDDLDNQIASTGFDVLRAVEVDPRWLFNVVRTEAFVEKMSALVQGALYPAIRAKDIRSFPVPLAPLNEQKRIADKLYALLARVDDCRDRLDRIPAILKRFRQSVVSYATDGGLTEDWRTQKYGCADKLITETNLQDLCYRDRVITYGVIKLGNDTADGVPCLRTSNVRWLKFENDGMKKIALSLSNEYSRTILQGNEVLVNVRGTLGGVAVATSDMAGWNVSREIAVIPVNITTVNPQFLALWIGADGSQRWLSGVERGVAYTGINLEDLRTLPVAIPKLEEQTEIVRRVESLFAYADRLEARYHAARAQVEKLTPSLLAKAFRGELVPQDPNDEPASELLARIVATKADAPPKKRAGKRLSNNS